MINYNKKIFRYKNGSFIQMTKRIELNKYEVKYKMDYFSFKDRNLHKLEITQKDLEKYIDNGKLEEVTKDMLAIFILTL